MSGVAPVGGQTIDPTALRNAMQGDSEASRVTKASQQFEAIFVRQFLGDALKPMIKGSLEEGGSINDTYRYFVTDMLSQSLANRGAFGISQQLSQSLAPKTPAAGVGEANANASSSAPAVPQAGFRGASDIRSTSLKINGTEAATGTVDNFNFNKNRL